MREYFRRARRDAGVRAHLIRTAAFARSCIGWVAVVLAIAGVAAAIANGLLTGVWISHTAILCAAGCAVNLVIWDKFGDRIAMLEAIDDGAPEPGAGQP
jgi:hypothetical protein